MKRILLAILILACLCIMAGCGHTHEKGKMGFDREHHWYTCTGCTTELERAEHQWDGGKPSNNKTIYTCATCGATKDGEYVPQLLPTVTEEQWKGAFNSATFKNVSATIRETFATADTQVVIEYSIQANGTTVYLSISRKENNVETSYIAKYQEGYNTWTFTSREQTIEDATFSIVPAQDIMSCESILKDYGLDLSQSFSSFTYNKEAKEYRAQSIGKEGTVNFYQTVLVKMDNGKIMELVAIGQDSHQIKLTFADYGTTEPLPSGI